MNGSLQLIEQRLTAIDSAAFQNLCDAYLILREPDLVSINRTGSQFGKQKTIKGTPDTFFRLPDGSLIFVEYTTQTKGLVTKIKEDIDKCLDPAKTGVSAAQVSKIIICFNSRLDVAEETEITQYANFKNVRIELINLDRLALEIDSRYLILAKNILAKNILGIPLVTGQLLPLRDFVSEYNNKGGKLSTPLDNIFLHRKVELAEIESILPTHDLLIISGFPGVGKTKIAIEAIQRFLIAHKDYSAFAVSKKDQDISEDLKMYLQQDGDYILLVDDANRQLPNFKQILGVFREKRKGNIKLLITVRDYALHDIEKECESYLSKKITLEKFTDQEIKELISSDFFKIKNSKYQNRIIEIADGNARLAIMAALLALQEQVGFLYGEGERIFELYDSYFKTFIKDDRMFSDKALVKTLGIVSFFFTIDRNNRKLLDSILEAFEMDYYQFNESINEFEKRELVEVQYNHARVSEQVMATYFFYKVFIKDETLSFRTLLFTCFPEWKSRFSDTIIPSNNAFGYSSVLNKISRTLDEYLYSILSDETKVLEFFNLFWFYKKEEILSFFHSKIKNFPEPVNPIYNAQYKEKDFVNHRNQTLDFLSNLLHSFTKSFIPALELAFEYCRKKPESLPEFVRRIKEILIFDDDDHRNNFVRQVELFKLLITKFKDKQQHYVQAFFELCKTFLGHQFYITKPGRNLRKHSLTFYQYSLPFYGVTKNFRQTIWETLFESYETYPTEVFSVISRFKLNFFGAIPKILKFDLSFIIPFIKNKLDPTNFQHIHFINEFVCWLNTIKLKDRSYQTLKEKFTSEEYDYFRKLDWNTLRGKQAYESSDYHEFQKLKEQDIRTSFVFKNEADFPVLHNAIKNILSLEENTSWGLNQALNVIVEENFLKNEELGFKLLESILNNYPTGLNPLYAAIKIITHKSSEWALRLWNLIKSWSHTYQVHWKLAFFDYLPATVANTFYKGELLATINSIDRACYLHFESFEKFLFVTSDEQQNENVEKNIIEEILAIVYEKNEKDNLKITLPMHFFEKYSPMLAHNFALLKKSYIQQEKIDSHFDFEQLGLQVLLQRNTDFLSEYIAALYADKTQEHNYNTDKKLSFVWDLAQCHELVESVANLIIENNYYFGISQHPLIMFFRHLSDTQEKNAQEFILNFISKYNTDDEKISPIFGVLGHAMKNFFETAYLHYLRLNTDIGTFKKIWWTPKGKTYSGNVIIGKIQAKEWENILAMTEKSENQLDVIPIKAYIKERIANSESSARNEKKQNFIYPSM